MNGKTLSTLALALVALAPIPLAAQGRCDSIQYHFIDDGAPASARRYRYAPNGQSYALNDSLVLDGRGIASLDVRTDRISPDTTWSVIARLTPAGASSIAAATASHVGHMLVVLVGDEIIQTAIIESALRTSIPLRTDLTRAAADSLASRARRFSGTGCIAPSR
jgi:preprotein translocase subunit SecD